MARGRIAWQRWAQQAAPHTICSGQSLDCLLFYSVWSSSVSHAFYPAHCIQNVNVELTELTHPFVNFRWWFIAWLCVKIICYFMNWLCTNKNQKSVTENAVLTSCEHLWAFTDAFVIVCILCAKTVSWLAYTANFACGTRKSFKVNPVEQMGSKSVHMESIVLVII